MFKKNNLKTIIITGASGFVGKYFLDAVKDDFNVIAIARRSRNEAGISYHPNIHWLQWDIGSDRLFYLVLGYIIGKGGADYLVHLAGFYNFDYKDNPEYERTNVNGTRNVLLLARKLNIKRFIFASSLAACKFVETDHVIDEKVSPDAEFHYAYSKKKGEEMVKEYSNTFNCSIVRFAAVYSDWCEYAPLYKFLGTWLGGKWDARILAGKGESSVPYIHIHDLCKLLRIIIIKDKELPRLDTYNASPDGSTTHLELFRHATRDFYGKTIDPFFLPKLLAFPGVLARIIMGKLHLIPDPFEKLWMVKYIDQKLDIDSLYTRYTLGWEPTPRYHILRRLLYLLNNMKSHSMQWEFMNELALKRMEMRPNLRIYEQMLFLQDQIIERISGIVLSSDQKEVFGKYQDMETKDFNGFLSQLFHLLLASVRSSDRSLMLNYIDEIAMDRFAAGFECEEITNLFAIINQVVVDELLKTKDFQKLKQEIYDYIGLTIQLATDEMENIFEGLEMKLTPEKIAHMRSLHTKENRQKMIEKLSEFYQEANN
jgi:nucleoside-diphosphate-sugar epimerase